jgi:hypothetical protein
MPKAKKITAEYHPDKEEAEEIKKEVSASETPAETETTEELVTTETVETEEPETVEELDEQIDAALAEEAPVEAPKEQDTYYVYNDKSEFVKFFTVAEHGADAEKKAKALAEEIGGSVQ